MALLMTEGRRAVLTPAGELLLNQVKPLLKAFAYVETRAATLRSGMRTRIDLMVDSIFSAQPAVRNFAPVSAAVPANAGAAYRGAGKTAARMRSMMKPT